MYIISWLVSSLPPAQAQFNPSLLRTPPRSDVAERLCLTRCLCHCTPGGYVNIFDIQKMLAQAIHKILEVTV